MTTPTKSKISKKEAWEAWHTELKSFKQRETHGFSNDVKALEVHIYKLQELAPRDKAGWLVPPALAIIDKLQIDYQRAFELLQSIGRV